MTLSNQEIWTEIAEAFYCEPEERTERQKNMSDSGVCLAYGLATNDPWPGLSKLHHSQGFKEFIPEGNAFFYPIRHHWMEHHRGYDLLRGDFATLMSCLTDEEFEELCQ